MYMLMWMMNILPTITFHYLLSSSSSIYNFIWFDFIYSFDFIALTFYYSIIYLIFSFSCFFFFHFHFHFNFISCWCLMVLNIKTPCFFIMCTLNCQLFHVVILAWLSLFLCHHFSFHRCSSCCCSMYFNGSHLKMFSFDKPASHCHCH